MCKLYHASVYGLVLWGIFISQITGLDGSLSSLYGYEFKSSRTKPLKLCHFSIWNDSITKKKKKKLSNDASDAIRL